MKVTAVVTIQNEFILINIEQSPKNMKTPSLIWETIKFLK